MLAKNSGSLEKKPKILEKYRCAAGEGQEVTIALTVEDILLGRTELILERKKEEED